MFGVWSSLLTEWAGIVLAGLTIKLMDDWLDVEFDSCIGRYTLAMRLGRACLPYALLCYGISLALAPGVALCLFLASYAIGMGSQLREKMPTKLPGWAESIVAAGLGAWIVDYRVMGWALCVMAMIQLLDDLMDLHNDRRSGQNNWSHRFGLVEATLLMFIFALAAVLLSPMRTVEVILATPVVHLLLSFAGGIGAAVKREEEEG